MRRVMIRLHMMTATRLRKQQPSGRGEDSCPAHTQQTTGRGRSYTGPLCSVLPTTNSRLVASTTTSDHLSRATHYRDLRLDRVQQVDAQSTSIEMTSLFNEIQTQNLLRMVNGAYNASEAMDVYSPQPFIQAPRSRAALDMWIDFSMNHTSLHDEIMQLLSHLQPALDRTLRASCYAYEVTRPHLRIALQNGIGYCNWALDFESAVQQAIDRWWAGMPFWEQTRCRAEFDKRVALRSRS